LKFKLTINVEEVGIYLNFVDAFTEMYKRVRKCLEEGYSWQALETMNWIEVTNEEDVIVSVMEFYNARDFACNIGLLTNGKLTPEKIKSKEALEIAWRPHITHLMSTTIT
jgi:hypothetical protein